MSEGSSVYFLTGFPSASSKTISPRFSDRTPASIFERRRPAAARLAPAAAYFFAAAFTASSVIVIVASDSRCSSLSGRPQRPEVGDLARDPSERLELLRVAAHATLLARRRAPSAVIGRARPDAFSSLSNSVIDSVVLSVCTPPPAVQIARRAHQIEVREHAVRVGLVLAQVQVEPRAEAAAAPDRVHQVERVVVAALRARRRASTARRPSARRRADRRGRSGRGGLRRGGMVIAAAAPAAPRAEVLLSPAPRASCERDVAGEDDRRADPASTRAWWKRPDRRA